MPSSVLSPGGSDNRISLQCRRPGFDPWVGKIPWRRKWQPTAVLLPGESHGQRNLWSTVHSVAESGRTEATHTHSVLSGEIRTTLMVPRS